MEPDEQTRDTSERAFQPLDARVVALWRVSGAIGFGLLFVLMLVATTIVASAEPVWLVPALAILVLFAGLAVWSIGPYPSRAYRAWGYRIDGRVLELRKGVLFHVSQLLPLTRLQHVDLRRGPLERLFGLASLTLHTAGTREATLRIPGLDAAVAARLRDHLVAVGGDDAV